MTLELDMWEKEYLADGIYKGPYGIPFPFQQAGDLRFYEINPATGFIRSVVDLTVMRFSDLTGGTFTFAVATPATWRVRVARSPQALQTLDLEALGTLQPDIVEGILDRMMMLHQETRARLLEGLRLPPLTELRGLRLPKPVGNNLLSWDGTATGIKNVDPSQFQGVPGPRGFPGPPGDPGAPGQPGRDGTAITVKGSKATIGDLPASGNAIGDAWIVAPNLHIWNGASFTNVGAFVGPPGAPGAPGEPGPPGNPGTGGGVSSHTLLTDLTADDHLQYHNDVRGLAWATALSTELPINQADIDAALAASLEPPAPIYRRPWAVRTHRHDVDQIDGLGPLLLGRTAEVDGLAAYTRLLSPLQVHGDYIWDDDDDSLTLRIDTGHFFHMRIRRNVTDVILGRGDRPAPLTGFSEEYGLFVQQPSTGDANFTIDFGPNYKFPGGTVIQPTTGNDAATLYKFRRSTASNNIYVEVTANYSSEDDETDPGVAGTFYGTWLGCDRVGNMYARSEYSSTGTRQWIPAGTIKLPKAGTIEAIRFQVRVNSPKLTTLGYGNGECTAWFEIRPVLADGTPDMGTLLARTANFRPEDFPNQHKKFDLQSDFTVPASRIVAILARLSDVSTAASQNINKAWSFNCTIRSKPLPAPRGGPAYGDALRVYNSTNGGDSWVEYKGSSGFPEYVRGRYALFGEFYYTDGTVFGNGNWFANVNNNHIKAVDGANNKVRQRYKPDLAVAAKGFYLRCYSRAASPTMAGILMGPGGTVIEAVPVAVGGMTKYPSAGSISDGVIVNGESNGESFPIEVQAPIVIFYTAFAATRTMASGSSYTMLFEAGVPYVWNGSAWVTGASGNGGTHKAHVATVGDLPASGNTTNDVRVVGGTGAAIRFWGVRNSRRAGEYENKQNFSGSTTDAAGEFTTNGGSSWSKLTTENGSADHNDVQLLFAG